jgi:hypothetical protein
MYRLRFRWAFERGRRCVACLPHRQTAFKLAKFHPRAHHVAMKHARSPIRALGVGLAAAMVLSAPQALAGQECECVGNGKRIKEGSVVCLQIGSSTRYLARCERNLNNTSWKKIADGCPTAQLTPWNGGDKVPG